MESDRHLLAGEQSAVVSNHRPDGEPASHQYPDLDSAMCLAGGAEVRTQVIAPQWDDVLGGTRKVPEAMHGASLLQALQRQLRQAEAELKKAREQETRLLEKLRDVEERQHRACAIALAEADNLSRLKTEFVNNMNHELRTPLHGIIGMATIGLRAVDVMKTQHVCRRILEAARELSDRVGNVLDFSSVDTGHFVLRPCCVDLGEAIEVVARRALTLATAKGLDFTNQRTDSLPHYCLIDGRRLGEVLSHLLVNAVKFTELGSITFVSKRDGAWLVFTVSDTGIGLSSDHVRQLFRPFEQADGSASRRVGGMGLGLALTDHLIRQMGGTIRVESALGKGGCFEVRLPFAEPPTEVSE